MVKLIKNSMLLGTVLFICTGIAWGQTWPYETVLRCKDWSQNEPQSWVDVGDVVIYNTCNELVIEITADEGFYIKKVNIEVALNDTEAFKPLLSNKGKPVPQKFEIKDELPEPDSFYERNVQLDLDPSCWGDPCKCPIERYIIVYAELFYLDANVYMNIGDGAYAFGDGDFEREISGTSEEEGTEWGWYILYPLSKIDCGCP